MTLLPDIPDLAEIYQAWSPSSVPRIPFCESNHFSSSLSAGMSVWDRNPRASKADGVGRQKFNSLDQSLTQGIVQVERGL